MFIALAVPEAVKERLRDVQRELRAQLPEDAVRWTRIGQIHLTLKFLGNVEVRRVDELVESVRRACAGLPSFQLTAGDIGFFPNAQRPRVIWAGVNSGAGELEELQCLIAAAASAFSSSSSVESFTGHLTLGRIKRMTRRDTTALERATASFAVQEFGSWAVTSVEVMRSELTSEESRHFRLAEIGLTD